jgi:hypothetical protein
MSTTIDDYRCKLINKILFAGSEEEVRRFVDEAMKGLEQHKVNGHIVARFVDKMISELENFNPMEKDAQQWSNIKMARVHFSQIKQTFETEPLRKIK